MHLRSFACLLLAACASQGASVPDAELAAGGCNSSAAPSSWREIVLHPGSAVMFVPPEYDEAPGNAQPPEVNARLYSAGASQRVTIQQVSGPATLDSAVFQRDRDIAGVATCRGTIDAHPAVVRLFRAQSRFPLDGPLAPSFEVRVTIEIEAGRYLHIHGVNASATGRDQQLAIARSVRILKM